MKSIRPMTRIEPGPVSAQSTKLDAVTNVAGLKGGLEDIAGAGYTAPTAFSLSKAATKDNLAGMV